MKKLLLVLSFAVAASAQTISTGAGFASYTGTQPYGYLAYSTPISGNSFSITTLEMLGSSSRLRTGFAHDIVSGPVALFALADAGVATNGTGSVGLNLGTGGGIRVQANTIPGVKKYFKSDNVGLVGTVLLNKSAVQSPDGTTGVQPTFTGGIYIKIGK